MKFLYDNLYKNFENHNRFDSRNRLFNQYENFPYPVNWNYLIFTPVVSPENFSPILCNHCNCQITQLYIFQTKVSFTGCVPRELTLVTKVAISY